LIHVYLDDLRPCPKGFTLARTVPECMLLLQECQVDVLSLDHDLGIGSRQTGMDVVLWMIRTGHFPRQIFIHTSSPSACDSMYTALQKAKPDRTDIFPHRIPEDLLRQISLESFSRES
jgi:hypothetical protein